MNPILSYLTAFATVALVAFLPARTMTETRSAWYQCIRPSITPPNIVFPIVWSILYVLIAISLAGALMLPASPARIWLLVGFAINLALNLSWTFLYFKRRALKASLAVILLLWATIFWIYSASYRLHTSKWKAYILLPYLLWVAFATVLNALSLKKEAECSTL